MTRRADLPDPLADRGFAVGEALSLGVPPSRLRARDLAAPFHGVRSRAGSPDPFAAVEAYASRMPGDRFFSHATAAALWRLPLPTRLASEQALHVSCGDEGGVARGRGVVGHRLEITPPDIVDLGGLRLTSRARTACDLASSLSTEELLALLDHLLWRRHPAPTRMQRAELHECIERHGARRGRPSLLLAASLATDRADSPPESVFRFRFISRGFPAVLPNAPVLDDRGRFVAMPDLAFAEYQVAFDYDGDIHRTDQATWRKDLRRAIRFEDAGWAYIRAGADDLHNDREVLGVVASRLRARGWRG